MVEIHLERTINAPLEQVFDYLADPAGLTAPPPVLRAHWLKGAPGPAVGAIRQVIGVGVWFREEITAYDRPRSYSYLILHSVPPLKHDGGTLTFTRADGGTHVDWLTNYTHPAYAGGKLMEAVTRRLLRSSFSDILAGCAKALESQR